MEMIFRGTYANVRVQTEFNIRALLNPGEIPVMRHDGTASGRLTLLPSAFFWPEIFCDAVTFHGGGNGHGVGMSQNGVRALLDMGLGYAEILSHYYPGTELTSLS
jgi:stage II sporulation protein D